jgi:preprotein translocase subunit SecG
MSIAINILLVIHVLVSLLIILLVLMQRPKNEGLGAAFGGGMTENLFGAQTTNVLQTATRYLGGIFFALTLLLSWLYVKDTNQKSTLQKRLLAPTVVPKIVTPAPGAATPAPDAKVGEKPAAPADEKKPETGATPTPAKPAAATPAPSEKPAGENKPAPAAPAPAPAPATPAAAPATPAAVKPAATPAPNPDAATAPAKPAEPEKTPEKPGN